MGTPRIYLTGRVSIENGENLVDERDFPGRQGRLAFVFLSTGRRHPIAREELVSAVWPDEQPRAVDTALSALLSKLRGAFRKAGLSAADAFIDVRLGAITMSMPDQTWVDIEAAANAIDEADGALRKEHRSRAWSLANVVVSVARRPFLLDEEAPWIEAQRTRLRTMLLRGLQCLSVLSAANAEPSLAVQYANEMIDIDPFLETAYQQLMRIHAQTGNRAEALRAFGRCRELLRDELGANPSPETQALFMEILRRD